MFIHNPEGIFKATKRMDDLTSSRIVKGVYEAVSERVLNRFGGKRTALAMNTETSLALNLIQILSVCCLWSTDLKTARNTPRCM